MDYKFIIPLCCLIFSANALTNLLNTPTHMTIRCLCHAVSGCYFLTNCAKYSVNYQYWQTAGSPVLNLDDTPSMETYRACIKDNNCILHTINNYVNRFGNMDCNCDGVFDGEDQLAIHYGVCENMEEMQRLADRKRRYKACSGTTLDMPTGTCIPNVV